MQISQMKLRLQTNMGLKKKFQTHFGYEAVTLSGEYYKVFILQTPHHVECKWITKCIEC